VKSPEILPIGNHLGNHFFDVRRRAFQDKERAMFLTRRQGTYYLWFTENGKRQKVSLRCATKAEALVKVRDWERKRAEPATVIPTLAEFRTRISDFGRNQFSVSTCRANDGALKTLERIAGNLRLEKFTRLDADTFKQQRLLEVQAVSVNVDIRHLRACFSRAVKWGMLKENPFRECQLVRIPEQEAAYLSQTDFQRLISVIREDWFRSAVIFSCLSGLRRGELCNLKWQDVDFGRKLLIVRNSDTFKTKSGRNRVVPLSDTAISVLYGMQVRNYSPFVVTLKEKQLQGSWLSHLFKRYVRALSLDGRLHWHSLRHTSASWLVASGASLYFTQHFLGHSSPTVTSRYAHLAPSTLHEAVNRVNVELN
jgi:integrase